MACAKEARQKALHRDIVRTFKNLDVNRDGIVTQKELAAMMKELDRNTWTDRRIGQLMDAIDKNKDGNFDYEDFVEWMMGKAKDTEKKTVFSTQRKILSIETLKELVGKSKAGETLLNSILDKLFDYYDLDGDDHIQHNEFVQVEEKRSTAMGLGSAERQACLDWFKSAGAEGDLKSGMYLSRAAFKEAMKKLADESAEEDEDPSRLATWVWENRAKVLLDGSADKQFSFAGLSERRFIAGVDKLFCVRYSPDDTNLAASFDSGEIHVYPTVAGRSRKVVLTEGTSSGIQLPTTMLRWRPPVSDDSQILMAVSGDGTISRWHVARRKLISKLEEPGNELYCLDWRSDGAQFATAGRNSQVQVYDEAENKSLFHLGPSPVDPIGLPRGASSASNRIFSLKYHPSHRDVILSAGWESIVKIWDLREGVLKPVRSLLGPHVCADSLDISRDGETILTGSFSETKQLQVWSFAEGKVLDTFEWRASDDHEAQPCKVYGAQFSKHDGSTMVLAGGSGVDTAKLFDWKKSWAPLGEIYCPAPCCSVDFCNSGEQLAVGCTDGSISLMDTF